VGGGGGGLLGVGCVWVLGGGGGVGGGGVWVFGVWWGWVGFGFGWLFGGVLLWGGGVGGGGGAVGGVLLGGGGGGGGEGKGHAYAPFTKNPGDSIHHSGRRKLIRKRDKGESLAIPIWSAGPRRWQNRDAGHHKNGNRSRPWTDSGARKSRN